MNKKNFERVLAFIEANPEHWDQRHWHCGTSHCFAGVAELVKHNLQMSDHEHTIRVASRWRLPTFLIARRFLGITEAEACWLFSAARTLDDFRMVRWVYCR